MDFKLLSLLLLLSSALVICSNVDTSNAIIFRGNDSGSYFGYSVKLYRYRNIPSMRYVLVGAPRANSSTHIFQTGNTFRCDSLDATSCSPLDLPGLSDPNEIGGFGDTSGPIEDKTTMWMGGSVEGSYDTGEVLTCGHRYFDAVFGRREPVGRCYVLPNPLLPGRTLTPCNDDGCNVRQSSTGHCLAGMAAHILRDGSQIYLGAPGFNYFRGSMIRGKVEMNCNAGFFIENIDYFGYLGYAIASGRITSSEFDSVVVSGPRQTLHQGNIHIINNNTNQNLDQILTFRGTSQDSYYGYSMLAVDLDGDGMDELLVSAPIYSVSGLPEIGQVLVYRNTGSGLSTTPASYIQQFRYGRFGTALADLGDLDADGFPEIAISAPYGDQAGTVFIYSGLSTGLLSQTPKQVIRGEDVGLPVGAAFGISISGKQDIDDNGYNDMLVGAYLNESAVLLRSLPVISISMLTASSPMFAVISLEDARATNFAENITYDGTTMEHAFFTLNLQISYSSPSFSTNSIMLNLTINSDQERSNSRVFFVESAMSSRYYRDVVNLTKGVTMNLDVRVYISDLSTEPYTFDFSYFAINPMPINFNTSVFITNLGAVPRLSVQPDVMCGEDRVCTPILCLTAVAELPTLPDSNTRYSEIIEGLVTEITISITALNKGEDSFGTRMNLQLPTGVSYRIASVENQELVIGCQTVDQSQIGFLTCSPLGRPLTRNQDIQFSVILDTSSLVGNEESITIRMTLVSDNPSPNATITDFTSNVTINVSAIADITVALESSPNRLAFNETTELRVQDLVDSSNDNVYSHSNLGPELTFTFTVRNQGPSSISNSSLLIHWPLGNSIQPANDPSVRDFYLYISRIDSSTIQCDQFFVNLRNLRTEIVVIDEGNNAGSSGGRRRRSVEDMPSDTLTVNSEKPGKKRKRRQSNTQSGSTVNTDINMENSGEAYVNFGCQIGRLAGNEETDVQIIARIFEPTLVTNSPDSTWTFSVYVRSIIGDSHVSQPSPHLTDSAETTITAVPSQVFQPQAEFTLWWVIVLAVGAFVALLIPIFIVLYFAGFFKKSKTKKAREEFEGKVKEWNEMKPDFQ